MSNRKEKEVRIPRKLDFPTGAELLHDPYLNQGTAFTCEERDLLNLRGLLPPRVFTQEEQAQRVMHNFHLKPNDLEKYIYMTDLEDRNENLFYRVLIDNLETLMPIVYTPTVGLGCQLYGNIFRRPRGLFISVDDRGHMDELVANWPYDDVRVIVVSDGERILGLGDLGANGMGIPVGKLSLYTGCAGINPSTTLPVLLDVGTNNEKYLNDPLYIGVKQPRLRGAEYDAFVEEFVQAITARFPKVLIQFEDFGNQNAFRLLEKYRDRIATFNDDIQGTAAVALAGYLTALRVTGKPLTEQTILFLGAGEAGVGIADLVVAAMVEQGMDPDAARQQCWFVDSRGLVVKQRADLAPHKLPYAHDAEPVADFQAAVERLQPDAIIGVSGQPRTFTQPIIEAMARFNERPIIFALSNPTSQSECTAEQAYQWSDGRAIFASGSPFPTVEYQGRTYVPGQGNNSYIFPGVGLGVVASEAQHVTDEMFMAAAKKLAELVSESDLELGRIYPPLNEIRNVSLEIATAVAAEAFRAGLARREEPENLKEFIRGQMYEPEYPNYV